MEKEGLTQEIRINSDYADIVYSDYKGDKKEDSEPKIRKKTLFTKEFVNRFFPKGNSIIPPNCRYIEKVTHGNIVIIEEPPALRTIKVSFDIEQEINKLRVDNERQRIFTKKELDTIFNSDIF